MSRKRDEYETTYNENRRLEPVTKKMKSPSPLDQQSEIYDSNGKTIACERKASAGTSTMEANGLVSRGILKPAQSTAIAFPNRKRRSRNSQEILTGMHPSTSSSAVNAIGQLPKKTDLSCVVCSDLAHGYNFDAISCESCKAFFRRNALFNMERLKCRRDGSCEITLETRRRCKSCRLKKCFTVGMRKEWILTEEEKVNKKKRIEENRRIRTPANDDSPTSAETNSVDSASRDRRTLIEKPDSDLQSVLLNKNERPPLKPVASIQNGDLISNVVSAFRDGFQLDPTSYGWSYPLARKITALCQILNTKNTTALRLISSYKRLHEFDSLNDMDKVNLVKSNLRYMFFFHGSLGYDPANDAYHEDNSSSDKPVYGADIRDAYGTDIHIRCTLIIRELHAIAQVDRRIIQLALVIFLFSKGLSNLVNSNEPSLKNYQQVLRIQNIYVEQLWLLLEKTYGPARAVLMYSTLISKCLLIQQLLRDIQHDVHEKLDLEEVSPIMRSVMQLA